MVLFILSFTFRKTLIFRINQLRFAIRNCVRLGASPLARSFCHYAKEQFCTSFESKALNRHLNNKFYSTILHGSSLQRLSRVLYHAIQFKLDQCQTGHENPCDLLWTFHLSLHKTSPCQQHRSPVIFCSILNKYYLLAFNLYQVKSGPFHKTSEEVHYCPSEQLRSCDNFCTYMNSLIE